MTAETPIVVTPEDLRLVLERLDNVGHGLPAAQQLALSRIVLAAARPDGDDGDVRGYFTLIEVQKNLLTQQSLGSNSALIGLLLPAVQKGIQLPAVQTGTNPGNTGTPAAQAG